jgi:hypothetical protein
MVVPLRDSGVRDSAFLPGMLFGPTTVEICGCLYPSAGPKRANEFGLVVTYQESGKRSFNLLSVKTLFEVYLDTSTISDITEVVRKEMGLYTFLYIADWKPKGKQYMTGANSYQVNFVETNIIYCSESFPCLPFVNIFKSLDTRLVSFIKVSQLGNPPRTLSVELESPNLQGTLQRYAFRRQP